MIVRRFLRKQTSIGTWVCGLWVAFGAVLLGHVIGWWCVPVLVAGLFLEIALEGKLTS